ncbi:hypothetical protein [Glaciecola petra]|uniref:Uncharacterized protein n=1 Tax=Glaciecola petra TaxID=3075602 RepID=A0ABU2ZMA4_9ALTE|nr:hypothetical protein [Aestuariibacter sp. P117]MDT0593541.1 hypothetical protein [Aestuariibacter sp. P117]
MFNRFALLPLFLIQSFAYADCAGPSSVPLINLNIESCKVSSKFDNILELKAFAEQIYSWSIESKTLENERLELKTDVFYISSLIGYDCGDVLSNKKKLWLQMDVCNDTGQNIPDIQILPLTQDIRSEIERGSLDDDT